MLCDSSLLINMRGSYCCNHDDIATGSQGKAARCRDPKVVGVAIGEEHPYYAPGT
jgi:hypothetical protein